MAIKTLSRARFVSEPFILAFGTVSLGYDLWRLPADEVMKSRC